MLTNWVFCDNLRPLLLSIGWFVGYDIDEDDLAAVLFGIKATDQETDHWFEYEFAGELRARLQFAVDPGTSVIHVRVDVPTIAEPKVEAAMSIFQTFRVQAAD